MTLADKGRRSEGKNYEKDTKFRDTLPPESAEMGMLIKQDEIIAKLNAILAAIETATDGDTLFTALDTAAIKATLQKVKLM